MIIALGGLTSAELRTVPTNSAALFVEGFFFPENALISYPFSAMHVLQDLHSSQKLLRN